MSARNCLACKHCYFYPYQQGWGEYTPSSPMSFHCVKGVWDINDAYGKDDIATRLDMAVSCEEWSPEPGHEKDGAA